MTGAAEAGARGLTALERLQTPEARRSAEGKATMRPLSFTLGGETVELRVLTIREGEGFKRFAQSKLQEILETRLDNGDAVMHLASRLLGRSAEEMIDLVLRYDLDGVIPREVDDEAGMLRSEWVETRATLEEVEGAFLAVLSVSFPFVRRLMQLGQGADWGKLLATAQQAFSSRSSSVTSQTPTR